LSPRNNNRRQRSNIRLTSPIFTETLSRAELPHDGVHEALRGHLRDVPAQVEGHV
jgi:hypothetical protein